MTENNLQHKTYFVLEELKKWSTRSCFVALTIMAVVLWSPAGDNVKDIWNSPSRLTAIETDINEINERLSVIDMNRMVTSVNP